MRKTKVDTDAFLRLWKKFNGLKAEDPVHSPCVGICHVNKKTQYCEGCFRTIGEIAEWGGLENAERRAVWLQLRQRRPMR